MKEDPTEAPGQGVSGSGETKAVAGPGIHRSVMPPGLGVFTRRGFLYRLAGLSGAAFVLTACGDGSNGIGGGGSGGGDQAFDAGDVEHILPSVTHERILVKVSFANPRPKNPFLMVNNRVAKGTPGDLERRFFTFDISGLKPDTQYNLQLFEQYGPKITSPWPLKTFPAPDADVSRLRLLCTTCPGGREEFIVPKELAKPPLVPKPLGHDAPVFQPMSARRRLLARALQNKPDAMLVNGDSVYWDMVSKTALVMGQSKTAKKILGQNTPYYTPLKFAQPVEGNANNELAVKKAVGPQIAGLYGVAFRSIPTFFVQDDHDFGDNDTLTPFFKDTALGSGPTFPPGHWRRDFRRFTQKLYYPELFAPKSLKPGSRSDLGNGLDRSYGEFRYGRLAEGLIYCCKVNFPHYQAKEHAKGNTEAEFIPQQIEDWLKRRTRDSNTVHTFQMPSTPLVWTAGKWLEFYPDILNDKDKLTTQIPKPGWPRGWNLQHDRILNAASARKDHLPLFFNGDVHSSGLSKITRSNDNDYSDNPIVALLVGTVGTGEPGMPSFFRGVKAQPSLTLKTKDIVEAIEQPGFSLVDFDKHGVTVRMFKWEYMNKKESVIDDLAPFHQQTFKKPTA